MKNRAEKFCIPRFLFHSRNIFGKNVGHCYRHATILPLTQTGATVLLRRMRAFIAPDKSDAEVAEQLSLKETRGWKIPDARKQMATIELPAHIESIAYRPFDAQHIMYHPWLLIGAQGEVYAPCV